MAGTVKLYCGKTLNRVCVDADLSGVTTLQSSQTTDCSVSNTTAVCSTRKVIDWSQFDWSQSELTSAQRTALQNLLERYFDLFSTGLSDIGRTNVTRHHIVTGDNHPLRQRPYRQPFSLRQEAEHQVQSMLENDIIKPSSSPWSSPVLLVPKKDGSFRFCIDFHRLNDVTVKDAYPIPPVDDTLAALGGAQFFSTSDLASGYWQIELDAESQPKTEFTIHSGHYDSQAMHFGLCNAPSTFQRLMELVLRGLTWDACLMYLDNIIIFSSTFEQHLVRLQLVLDRFRQAGLKLSPIKCHFAKTKGNYLGHQVSKRGILTDPSMLAKVLNWPTPKTVKEVKAFLGIASYYRRFIDNFAHSCC